MLKLMVLLSGLIALTLLLFIAFYTKAENSLGLVDILPSLDIVNKAWRKSTTLGEKWEEHRNDSKSTLLTYKEWSNLNEMQVLAKKVDLLYALGVHSFDSHGLMPETGLNPGTDVLLFMPIRTTAFDERKAARKIFGIFNQLPGLDWKYQLVFVLGKGYKTSKKDRALINGEAKSHNDMILSQVEDTYMTLLLKEISGYFWITKAFNSSSHSLKWIVKIDDDVLMHPWKFEEIMHGKYFAAPGFTCHVGRCDTPIRNPESKWYVPYFVFPNEKYPQYCNGPSYTMSLSAVLQIPALFSKTFLDSCIWLEDLYITGLLGIPIIDDHPQYMDWKGILMLESNQAVFIHYTNSQPIERLGKWVNFLNSDNRTKNDSMMLAKLMDGLN